MEQLQQDITANMRGILVDWLVEVRSPLLRLYFDLIVMIHRWTWFERHQVDKNPFSRDNKKVVLFDILFAMGKFIVTSRQMPIFGYMN